MIFLPLFDFYYATLRNLTQTPENEQNTLLFVCVSHGNFVSL